MAGLEGRAALVTGGGSGIGLGCATRLAADGATVTICARNTERLADAAAGIEKATGATVQWIGCDVTNEDDVIAAVAKAAEPTGRIDVVVACAGGSSSIGPITQLDTEKWRDTIDLNVTGTMLTIKHAARVMAKDGKGGSIIGISSIASSNIHPWFGAYGVAKAGIDHVCQLAADELGASGIRVNAVRPGLVDTELVSFVTAGGPVLEDYLECMPLRRVGTPEDIANAVRFLAGDESTWITGQTLNVDGGHCLRRGPSYRAILEPVFGEAGLRGIVD